MSELLLIVNKTVIFLYYILGSILLLIKGSLMFNSSVSNPPMRIIFCVIIISQLVACISSNSGEDAGNGVSLGDKGQLLFKSFKAGDVQWVEVGDLLPTQMNIGQKQNDYKLARWQKEPEKLFEELCETYGMRDKVENFEESMASALDVASFECYQPREDKEGPLTADQNGQLRAMANVTPVYVAPNGELYLTDGHHTNSRFYDMVGGGTRVPVLVNIVENLSDLESMGEFWDQMVIRGNAYLFDNGEAITYSELPRELGQKGTDNVNGMGNDHFRAVTYYTRDIGWDNGEAENIPFLEYMWAEEFRPIFDISGTETIEEYVQIVLDIANFMVILPDYYLLGTSGKTTLELGKLSEVTYDSAQEVIENIICEWDEDNANEGELELGKLGWAFYNQGIAIEDFPAPCNNLNDYSDRYDLI